ncbi:hypothetical protein [Spirosoma terrae]|uniref:Uncharacterized protein n=1 Tax=Spirosoma terrae TaxID=1968276 RepID=A0A6L9L566_9BACT|nr:hypothetical protein [Spirosoma terrae]NDU95765.1 hypothetical protein [Spirosoma terrae]
MDKLTAKQIMALPRRVTYQTATGHWAGYSDGTIHKGSYLRVYPARSYVNPSNGEYRVYSFRSAKPINVPLTRVFTF